MSQHRWTQDRRLHRLGTLSELCSDSSLMARLSFATRCSMRKGTRFPMHQNRRSPPDEPPAGSRASEQAGDRVILGVGHGRLACASEPNAYSTATRCYVSRTRLVGGRRNSSTTCLGSSSTKWTPQSRSPLPTLARPALELQRAGVSGTAFDWSAINRVVVRRTTPD